MGFRFRRSIKLMPGVRLNFSLSGVSATIGPRGLSYNIGPRGRALNLGIPGTGLSYRQSLAAGQGRPGPTARETERLERQARRETERRNAEAQHQSRELVLSELRSILANRAIQPLEWAEEFAELGPFHETPFEPTFAMPTIEAAVGDLQRANPLRPWILSLVGALAAVAVAPQWWLRAVLVAPAAYLLIRTSSLHRLRQAAAGPLLGERVKAYHRDLDDARQEYQRDQEAARNAHEAEDRLRQRMRDLERSEDFGLASDFLAAELSNEDLPIPIEFDIHCDNLRSINLTIVLPSLEVVPETRTALTKTGRLSEKAMTIRDRKALYEDVCAGVALRLMYETLRVLPFVESVVALGVTPTTSLDDDPEHVLRVSWTRAVLNAVDLDKDPSELFRQLGGLMSQTRYGDLKPLPDIDR